MKPLAPFPFNIPGTAGLNKQGQTAILGPEWATRATDLVVDSKGRLANRLGYRSVVDVKTALSSNDIETTFVGINNAGTRTLYCSDSNGDLYELVSDDWVKKTGSVTLPSDGNWQFSNFNGKVVAWHADGRMVVQSAPGANFANIVASTGTVPAGNAILAAFGRLWVVTNTTLYYSDLLDETAWGATPNKYELKYIWPNGADVATGLAEFNKRLVVFGKSSIAFLTNAWAVGSMSLTGMELEDSIKNIGCINRDTIEVVGKDIMFLSHVGIQSLGRVIQERSAPVTDVVPQVRDYVAQEYASSVANNVQSAYAADFGFYVLSLAQTTIVVDTRYPLPNGGYRVTEWAPMGAVSDDGDGGLYVTHADDCSKYQGVLDGVAFDGSGGSSVEGDYESGWQDWGSIAEGAESLNKFLKRIKMFIAGGGSGTLTMKWFFNYEENATTRPVDIPAPPNAAQYGVAQYAIDKYGTSLDITELSKPGAKGGRVIKVGCKIVGSTTAFAINQLTLYATVGKQAH